MNVLKDEVNSIYLVVASGCLVNQFRCSSGQCISVKKRCDFRYDCQNIRYMNDFSDEKHCCNSSSPIFKFILITASYMCVHLTGAYIFGICYCILFRHLFLLIPC